MLFDSFDSATWFCGSMLTTRGIDAQVSVLVTEAPAASARIAKVVPP